MNRGIEYRKGVRIEGTNLWLDATERKPVGYVSHAHLDHSVPHSKVIASRKTARLYSHRCKAGEIIELDYNQPLLLDGVSITLFPAGHILGSSQILLETDRRWVYTGDFRMVKGETAEPIEVKPCDVLIMESTFGRYQYFFPKRDDVIDDLLHFVESARTAGKVPVIYAYTLGKSQEVIKILGDIGYLLSVHPRIYDIAKLYEQLGVSLQGYELFDSEKAKGKVVLMPPYAVYRGITREIPRKATAILTGWAMNSQAAQSWGVDKAIPLSDHADFVELVAYVHIAGPKKIYTLHGSPEFARFLRKKGFDAEHLPSGLQLRFWEDL